MIEVQDILADDWLLFSEKISVCPNSSAKVINQIYQHTVCNRGKRLRASLVMLMSKALAYKGSHHIDLACVVEWLHAATLIHDDIIDGADERSNQSCAHIKFNNTCAVLGGDYLYGMAFENIAQLNSPEVTTCIANATTKVIEGELLQLQALTENINSKEFYNLTIESKTATLFQVCTEVATILNNCSDASYKNYGYHFGMAYQMYDDLRDYLDDPIQLGKNIGNDFRERKITLPIIIASDNIDTEDLFALEFTEAVAFIKQLGGFELTVVEIVQQLNLALATITDLDESKFKIALCNLAEHILVASKQLIAFK